MKPEIAQVPIDVYPVGVLSAWQRVYRAVKRHRTDVARGILRTECRHVVSEVRKRDWRSLRNSFNGYLAEHQGCAHNCGRGWTKRAARRRAERLCQRHIAAALASLDPTTSPASTGSGKTP